VRVAIVSSAALAVPPPAYGGTERIVQYLVAGLVGLGHEVTLFATGDSRSAATLRFLHARAVWPLDSTAELRHVAWSMAVAARGGFDVVHANYAAAVALSPLLDAPLVYTLHHDRRQPLSRLYAALPRVHYVAISARQRQLERALPRVHLVHHGLAPEDFPFVPSAEEYVAFVSRFSAVKAPHHAIDAARRAGVPIRLAGRPHPGDEVYYERELVPRLRQPGVTWEGEVGGEAKAALVGRARATLFPICWEEPFGIVMIESMLFGTPVVAFARGAAPEVIDDGITGLVVQDADEMAAAIPLVSRYDRARCRAHAARRFGAARMVRDYVEVYERAVAEWRPGGTAGASAG
jgi:glycosyltransferase involved in cell wall biosynthesis